MSLFDELISFALKQSIPPALKMGLTPKVALGNFKYLASKNNLDPSNFNPIKFYTLYRDSRVYGVKQAEFWHTRSITENSYIPFGQVGRGSMRERYLYQVELSYLDSNGVKQKKFVSVYSEQRLKVGETESLAEQAFSQNVRDSAANTGDILSSRQFLYTRRSS